METIFTKRYFYCNFTTQSINKMKAIFINMCKGILLFFLPAKPLVLSVGVAIFADTFTGIYKSVKLNGWKSIRSRKASDIVSKMLLYEAAILSLYAVDYFLLNELTLKIIDIHYISTKIASVTLILIELTSIKENIEEALKIDIWKTLKQFISRSKEIKDDIKDLQG